LGKLAAEFVALETSDIALLGEARMMGASTGKVCRMNTLDWGNGQ
jgi:hypothetical protein